ncbi:NAD/NADP dependent alcohol dehydrogenase [Desmophyllum pertusum]|uniref:NAD/NADP dependent alcohol dehydrogenase n=1 Tax=Desmophyllum pertusum TaxID=174260 RepID=A0A9W9ZNH3_9CNID|nr:NAD/NADP dependent alcohol dehydrogenase [Desmophyllum pertusum]
MIDGGLDYTFECIGNVQTMQAALEASHVIWGTTVLVGIAGVDQEFNINPSQYLFGKTMKGSLFGGYKGKECIPKLADKYMAGRLKVDELITHTMPLDKINDAFDLMHAGKGLFSYYGDQQVKYFLSSLLSVYLYN